MFCAIFNFQTHSRALLRNPDILILDEATSNLDSITEHAIQHMINHIDSSMTIIIIAHRLSTIMRCDNIFIMKDGEIIESGTHEELIDKKSYYYTMWKEQLVKVSEKE